MRKTAFLTILAAAALFVAGCTDDPNTGRPDDGTTEEPGTENPDTDEPGTEDNTDRISLITFRNDEGYEHYWAFTYDSQDRPVAVDFNGTEEDDTFFYHYQIDYSDNHVRFYDDTISIDLTLDASGKAVSGVYHEYYDEYGYPEESETAPKTVLSARKARTSTITTTLPWNTLGKTATWSIHTSIITMCHSCIRNTPPTPISTSTGY